MIRAKKNWSLFAVGIILIAIIIFYMIIAVANPLQSYGHSYSEPVSNHVFVELRNEGFGNIKLKKVHVNDMLEPSNTKLVISYTNRAVTHGVEEEETASFIPLHAEPIAPYIKGNSEQISKTIQLNVSDQAKIPINYGVELKNDEAINKVTIRYDYFGIKKELTVSIR